MPASPHLLTDLTIVLGPPRTPQSAFADFQRAARRGESVADHPWAQHEYAALDALTRRDGSISTQTLLETLISSVVGATVVIADVDRQWVCHEDGDLYVSLTIASESVRPRAVALAMHDPAIVEALNGVADTLSVLDGRVWILWSSRTQPDSHDPTHLARAAALVGQMAELVIREAPTPVDLPPEAAVSLEPELLTAIRFGREHAELPTAPISRELRAIRYRDPMRAEWASILMDAFFLGALDVTQLDSRLQAGTAAQERAGLAYLFLGRDRAERLKANPEITPRFRGEIAAKTFMTAYALERLSPVTSAALFAVMSADV